jgi:hypothetical protein
MPIVNVKELYERAVRPSYPDSSKIENVATVGPGNIITCRGEEKMTCVFETSWKERRNEFKDVNVLDFPESFKMEKKRIVHASVPNASLKDTPICGIITLPCGGRVLACKVISRA